MALSLIDGRQGRPEEIAAIVRFLVSSEGPYTVGQTIHVNAGLQQSGTSTGPGSTQNGMGSSSQPKGSSTQGNNWGWGQSNMSR